MYKSFSEFLFPKQVIVSDSENFPSYRDELIKLCYKHRELDPQGVRFSNYGGWQSRSDYLHNNEEFAFLFDDLDANLEHCMQKDFNINPGENLSILNAWINISGQNNFNLTHTHPLSSFSGVYYVKCPQDCGNLVFEQDNNDTLDLPHRQDRIKDLSKMYSTYYFTPVEGRMLLFPSNLRHSVEPNKSCDDRISISFNLSFY